jgi:cytoplasmic iron level regulating protein YaaA (DUF328/UPF0246 family)
MLTILTPSKTMDFTTPPPAYVRESTPCFSEEARRLRARVAKLPLEEIRTLMKVSEELAVKTHQLYKSDIRKPAFWAYDGDVFKGVQAHSLTEDDSAFAQAHVVVPSAVYGLVRPYDLISPYRLEMKAKLAVGDTKNLYAFWGDKLGRYIEGVAAGEVLMLSSYEYARTILPYVPATTRVVTPAFIDKKPNGQEAQVAIYNKMMRGVMARWVIDNRIDTLSAITTFAAHGYAYDVARSTDRTPVFYRQHMTPLKF